MPDDDIYRELKALSVRMDRLERAQHETVELLRGTGTGTGLIGRVDVMWRTWVPVLTLIGAACGYLLRTWTS